MKTIFHKHLRRFIVWSQKPSKEEIEERACRRARAWGDANASFQPAPAQKMLTQAEKAEKEFDRKVCRAAAWLFRDTPYGALPCAAFFDASPDEGREWIRAFVTAVARGAPPDTLKAHIDNVKRHTGLLLEAAI